METETVGTQNVHLETTFHDTDETRSHKNKILKGEVSGQEKKEEMDFQENVSWRHFTNLDLPVY